MSNPKSRQFDCVHTAREARDRVSAEIENMTHEQLVSWLRSHRYSDPVLSRLAEKAAQQADSAAGAAQRR
jgi:N-acetylglucosamine kinase-like BadF-type ATPase